MTRRDKTNYYLDIAETVLTRGTCLRRSVHAEANAIIHADRADMIGATMYLAGRECATGEYIQNANSCAMCKRMIINAGIETVVIRQDKDHFRVISVQEEWVQNDESLEGTFGY